MDREILFRAKHIHALEQNEHLNDGWIEGYLSDENYINSPELGGEFLVDKNTVCQYTGMKDRNGKKIFQGDILSAYLDDDNPGEITYVQVVWNGISWCIKEEEYVEPMVKKDCEIFEVIGNIFDNPELLEDG